MNILLFSGTSDGRRLSGELADRGARVTVCVATAYGGEEQGEHDGIRVLTALKDFPQYLRVKPINPMEVYYYERGKDAEALLQGCVKVMEQVVARFETIGPAEESGEPS